MADEDILRDRQVGKQARLLVDDRDPKSAGLGGTVDLRRLPVEVDRPAVGLMNAGEDLDEGALPGTVLADQRVDLAGQEIERDVVKGLRGGEAFGDPVQLDARRCGLGRRHGHRGDLVAPDRSAVEGSAALSGPRTRTSTPRAVSASNHGVRCSLIGQDDADLIGRAERGERRPLPLRVVDDGDDLACRGDHRPLDLGFLVGGVGQPGLRRETRRTEERLLDVDPAEEAIAELADDGQRLPAHPPAEHQHRDPRMTRELRCDSKPIRDDRQLAPAAARLELTGDRQGRRARVHDDALAVVDEVGGGNADPSLLVSLQSLADLEGELGAASVDGDCPTVGPDESVLGLQDHEVLPDRDPRHAELSRQIAHPRAPMLLDGPHDVLLALSGENVARGGAGWIGHASPPVRQQVERLVSIGSRRTVDFTGMQCQEGN